VPVGGGGGGGGGDSAHNNSCSPTDSSFINDYSGGGGGGGGGVLIVKALGTITVTSTGKIIADGGHGGGGEQAGSCNQGGGGGAGSGGMVVLMSATKIVLHAHGNPINKRYLYGADSAGLLGSDYDFVLSADGGVCLTGDFAQPLITDKYPASGQTMTGGITYDQRPLGALGGMGLVQLMVPPGNDGETLGSTVVGTGTRLDDAIEFMLRDGVSPDARLATPAEKKALLAWRGFANPNNPNTRVDDYGAPLAIGNNEGDIRPSPILMPVPFNAQSRLRSKWLDTGASKRRQLGAPDGLPRGVVGTPGPVFSFAGITTAGPNAGYVDYSPAGTSGVTINYPIELGGQSFPISGIETGASYLGQPAYRVKLTSFPLGENDRYAQYQAELTNASNSIVGSFRILSNTAGELLVDAADGVVPEEASRVRVRAKFFKIITNGGEGLGPVYTYFPAGPTNPVPVPNSNVRIGFAFHADPKDPNKRFPANQQQIGGEQFVYDIDGLQTNTAYQAWVAANGNPRYVQWDVLFDLTFDNDGSTPPSLNPNSPRPELHWLRVPFTF
jgi:hypothetical protein